LSRLHSYFGRWMALLLCAAALSATPAFATAGDRAKLDATLKKRAAAGHGRSRVIAVLNTDVPAGEVRKLGAVPGRRLSIIGAQIFEIPDSRLDALAARGEIASLHHDRPLAGAMSRVAVASGARSVQQVLGLTGAGVGVAVIDSGVSAWHDDLQYLGGSSIVQTTGGQRVAAFVDFVHGRPTPYDDYGHGTHVAGIIAGNGYDSRGHRAGMAPDAHIVSLKVLDGNGRGVISNVIAALDYAIANRTAHNIRVVNLSVGAPITESYKTDPLTLAAKRAVDAGIVVVAAAGNLGRNQNGEPQYGGITAPGNAPWVLTVGAASDQGTITRTDDVVAGYSSRGPTAIDFAAKPDLVAFGAGVVSLSSVGSTMYATKPGALVSGIVDPGYQPYLSLSGTSMAAPAVAGTVALMLQANPTLTPNLVKAVLEYTAQSYPAYDGLTQGAGFLNARGAVDLARYFATAEAGQRYPSSRIWSHRIIWGNRRVHGGAILPSASAWRAGTVWGAALGEDGDNIVWGTDCTGEDCDNIVWGTECTGEDCDNIVWGTDCTGEDCDNIVWGTDCNGEDCDNIVWGTDCTGEDCDNIVWGTDCTGEDCDNIVWGTDCTGEDCDNIVWGTGIVEEVVFPEPEAVLLEFEWTWEAIVSEAETWVTLMMSTSLESR
jgi:subtilisin family serine protease